MIRNISLSLMALILLLPVTLNARQPVEQDQQLPGRGFMKDLNLSDEQQQQIEKLRTAFMKEMIDHRAKMATSRLELRELVQAETVDRATVDKKASEISQLHAKQQSRMIDHWFSVNKILKPEQQKIWKKRFGMGMMMGGGPGFGGRMMRGQRGFGPDERPMRMREHMMR